ncbi:hypothetical protein FDP08_07820 [Marinobacter panjinensis]|uniref:Uncharacterized protein n=1 Tax=Marinobacter panjinensis TaxID=2576384 RepID=A0A4U6R3A5_9GAMM|nr:hypothetical protein [Marinobacter panjinensis]MCR8913319.1 hypothetical protein [Marinobacter panjinensis]TKV68009.1 hypothetical protein FDP08_07820 [Marinobacter panjinensis]
MEHSPGFTPCLYKRLSFSGPSHRILWLVMLLAITYPTHPLADEQSPLPMALDGKSFQSRLGPVGQPADVDDLLVFEDGYFVSRECERRCGYAKVEYWLRTREDGIEMRAEVPCTDSGAMMYWRGTVRGDEIEGSFTWVNKRWYWTFEKEFWFEGRLVKADNP